MDSYKPSSLGAAPLVAAALGRSLGVKVVVDGSAPTASTDGKTIVVPRLPVDVDEDTSKLLWGFIHHEAAHCRHTDFPVWFRELGAANDNLVSYLTNVFEDIRIERSQIALYPGSAKVLDELVEVLVATKFFDQIVDDDDTLDVFLSFVLTHLRSSVLKQVALKPLVSTARSVLTDRLGEGFVTRLNAELQLVLDATCTQDAVDLALRIRDFLEDEKEKAKEQRQASNDASDSDDSGTDTSDESSSDDSASDHSGSDVDDSAIDADSSSSEETSTPEDAQSKCDDADNTTSDDASADDDSDQISDADGPTDADSSATNDDSDDASSEQSVASTLKAFDDDDVDEVIDALQRVMAADDLNPDDGDLGKSLAELLEDQVDGQLGSPVALPSDQTRKGGRDLKAVSEARRNSSRLSVQLKRVLSSENLVISEPSRKGKRISRRHLTRLKNGDDRIMVTRTYEEATNTALVFLVDVSGSMKGEKVELAARAALSTSLALAPIPHLVHAIGAFPGTAGANQVELVRDFHETTELVAARFGLLARGFTPMSEALLWATERLSLRQEQRKIICVATDGQPDDVRSTKQVLTHVRRLGIESHCLGINTPDTGLFDSFAEVTAVEKLTSVYLTLFEQLLRKTA